MNDLILCFVISKVKKKNGGECLIVHIESHAGGRIKRDYISTPLPTLQREHELYVYPCDSLSGIDAVVSWNDYFNAI